MTGVQTCALPIWLHARQLVQQRDLRIGCGELCGGKLARGHVHVGEADRIAADDVASLQSGGLIYFIFASMSVRSLL